MALKDKLMTLEDFKAVRDVDVASNSAQFTEIKADLDAIEPGLSNDAKIALLACIAHIGVWSDDNGQDYYDRLEAALNVHPETIRLTNFISGVPIWDYNNNSIRTMTEDAKHMYVEIASYNLQVGDTVKLDSYDTYTFSIGNNNQTNKPPGSTNGWIDGNASGGHRKNQDYVIEQGEPPYCKCLMVTKNDGTKFNQSDIHYINAHAWIIRGE